MKNERRKFLRVVVEGLIFAMSRPNSKRLIRIVNMSRNGLACEYLVHKKMNKSFSESRIDILLFKNESYSSKIPCKAVYDIKMLPDGYGFNNGMERRRCGLEFNELTDNRREQIELFMRGHLVEAARKLARAS
ncbi:MAG TPA: hypothetical protein VMW42_13060 [Desulfatiglandales bacterium]|nr:hypothetical protein [Desulfatiglandales bacterium]